MGPVLDVEVVDIPGARLFPAARLNLQPVEEISDVEEAPAYVIGASDAVALQGSHQFQNLVRSISLPLRLP